MKLIDNVKNAPIHSAIGAAIGFIVSSKFTSNVFIKIGSAVGSAILLSYVVSKTSGGSGKAKIVVKQEDATK